jgi:ABC-type glutathione transport system ATPase component
MKAGRKDLKSLGSKTQLKGSPLRKGLHDADSEDGTEVDDGEGEERVTIRSLDEKVAVGGKNFSTSFFTLLDTILMKSGQGQRQLLALARGLLKLHNSSFLIMDESTANLDHATDQTIQNVLRTGLKDTQMLVIAHRLLTVVELDK